jgi:hypothetical protein
MFTTRDGERFMGIDSDVSAPNGEALFPGKKQSAMPLEHGCILGVCAFTSMGNSRQAVANIAPVRSLGRSLLLSSRIRSFLPDDEYNYRCASFRLGYFAAALSTGYPGGLR